MIEFEHVFLEKTKNVRNFLVMMDGLGLGHGEGRLGMVSGKAGRGKSSTIEWYHSNNKTIFLRMESIWDTSPLDFLQKLCIELGFLSPPGRKGPAFTTIVDTLLSDPKPIFLDEIEKLPKYFLDVVRDLSDLSTAPIVLIGEDELVSHMRLNARVWSRTYQSMEFQPVTRPDIVAYFWEAAKLKVDSDVIDAFYDAATGRGGDFRVIRWGLLILARNANARNQDKIDVDMAQVAIKAVLPKEIKR